MPVYLWPLNIASFSVLQAYHVTGIVDSSKGEVLPMLSNMLNNPASYLTCRKACASIPASLTASLCFNTAFAKFKMAAYQALLAA